MAHSTFVWNKINVYENFGRKHIETWFFDNNLNSQLPLGKVSKELANYRENNYRDLPIEFYAGATFNNRPIVFMLAYVGHKETSFIIYTRNE